ncbi:MAG: LacI family DNA-binding transcriptional regulator [Phycisphaerae bacterium]|nr:LacI family DNA-binding transcriptional regulator [Phycisphaerae bacterium]
MPNGTTKTSTRLNMAEIARRCNVSRTTVGRVLNNKLDKNFSVREELRQKILHSARELGYRPNLAALSLAQARTNLIGVLGYDHHRRLTGVCQSIVESLVDTLGEKGFDVFIAFPFGGRSSFEPPRWQVDGVVVLNAGNPVELESLEASGLPYVSVNGTAGPSGISISPDDTPATNRLVDYLVSMGHRRIAYANPLERKKPNHISEEIRHQAYLTRLSHHGLSPVAEHDRYDMPEEEFLARILAGGATALIAYDHHILITLFLSLARMGVAVPERLSLVCFNDEYLVNRLTPPITAAALPSEEMGRLAGQLLLQCVLEGQFEPGTRIQVDTQLRLRRSVADLTKRP